jgi:uncharacterized protein (TIGR02118 family)
MITRMGLMKKKPSWTTEAFRQHWRDHHGALAAQLPGLRRYHQNQWWTGRNAASSLARGPSSWMAFSQLWFDGVDAMREAMATPDGRALVADEQHFIGDLRVSPVQRPPWPPVLQRWFACHQAHVAAARRRADVSAERFAHACRWTRARSSARWRACAATARTSSQRTPGTQRHRGGL